MGLATHHRQRKANPFDLARLNSKQPIIILHHPIHCVYYFLSCSSEHPLSLYSFIERFNIFCDFEKNFSHHQIFECYLDGSLPLSGLYVVQNDFFSLDFEDYLL